MIKDNPVAALGNPNTSNIREKEWEEMGSEEKINKLKRLVDAHTRRLQELDHYWCLIREHSHQGDKIVIPMSVR